VFAESIDAMPLRVHHDCGGDRTIRHDQEDEEEEAGALKM
jgi:hypothetical protein